MGAYYHILAPFRISIKEDAQLEKDFQEKYGQDFVFEGKKHIEHFSPALPDGTRLDFSYTEKTYRLPREPIMAEFEEFLTLFYTEWEALYSKRFKSKMYSMIKDADDIPRLVKAIKAVLEADDWQNRELKYAFDELDPNLFYIENIAPQVVYEGYPIKTDKHTDLSAFSLISTYEKMGVIAAEYAAFVLLLDKLQENYADKYLLAKYLFIAGY